MMACLPTSPQRDYQYTFDNLIESSHTLSVKAKDLAGHEDSTPLTINFTVDVTPPDTTIANGPVEGGVIASRTVTFEWTGSDNFESIDGRLKIFKSQNPKYL